jgi:hypothetical protein
MIGIELRHAAWQNPAVPEARFGKVREGSGKIARGEFMPEAGQI